MKRIHYIFAMFAALLALSCAKEVTPDEEKGVDYEGQEVMVYFGVKLPEMATKALGENPNITSIHVAVFGSSGYLKEYKLATPVNGYVSQEGIENAKMFSVPLSITSSRIRVNIIANGPATLDFDYESVVMSKITSTNGEDAYWQRVILDHGIYADKDDPGYYETPPVLVIDPDYDLDADGVTHKMAMIPLIRNYAKLTVVTEPNSNIVINSFAVVNVPDKGSIAPYNSTTGEFMMDYHTYATLPELSAVYPGNMPGETTINTSFPSETDFANLTGGVVAAGGAVYMYERPVPVRDATIMIVNATYTDPKTGEVSTGYYKIDMMEGSAYLPILRNFRYQITIQKVFRKGKATVAAAVNGAGSADISADISTASQVNLSDGDSAISVEFTEKTHPIGGTYTIGVSFTPDISTGVVDNTLVTYQLLAAESTGAVIASENDITYNSTTGTITYTTTAVDQTRMKSQKLRVIGTSSTSRLYRDITIRLLPKQTMTVSCVPQIEAAAGTEQVVAVRIPKDLPQSIFPLHFQIEASNKTLTPNANDLPVEPGPTIVTGQTGSSYQFVKTLSYSDYVDGYTGSECMFLCYFKSVIAVSDSDIYVANPYFITGSTSFTTFQLRHFTDLAFSTSTAVNEDDPVEFSFKVDPEAVPQTVHVYLTGLIPDGSAQGLTNISGNHYVYSMPDGVQGQGTQRLSLLSTGETKHYAVRLTAEHYSDATCANAMTEFANPTFGTVFYGNGWPTTFSFTIPNSYEMPAGGIDIELSLTNLVPNDGNITTSGGKYYYHVSTKGTKTLNFMTADNRTAAVSVELIHEDFDDFVGTTSDRSYLNIAAGKITNSVPNATRPFRNNRNTVHVYTDINSSQEVSNYTTNTSNNGTSVTNYSAASFSGHAVDASTMLYFSMRSEYYGSTYWASMTASALYNNGNNVTVTFGAKPTFATGISLNKTSTSIQRGSTETLTATVTPNNATDRTVTWTSSNPSVATVNSSGVVTAVNVGNATITATTNDGTNLSASCTVTVYWFAVTGITVTPASATIFVGNTTTLTANVTPANASNQSVTWSSSNTNVATVNANGVVTGVSEGVATITATTADGGYTATATITVNPVRVTGVTLDQSTITLRTSGTTTQQLTATIAPANATNKNVTWTSANTSIATVSNTGLVTAVAPGTTTVTVTTEDGGYTATCTVKVQRRVWQASSYTVNVNSSSTYNTNSFTDGVQNVTFTNTDAYRNGQLYCKQMGTRSGFLSYSYSSGYYSVTAPSDNALNTEHGGEGGKIIGLTMSYDGDYHQTMTYTANGNIVSGSETAFGTTTTNTSEVTGYNTVSVTYSCTNSTQYNSRMRLLSLTVYYSYYVWEDVD